MDLSRYERAEQAMNMGGLGLGASNTFEDDLTQMILLDVFLGAVILRLSSVEHNTFRLLYFCLAQVPPPPTRFAG